jgi:hypothetical protein
MKKRKIILSAVAVVGIVGGSLAFKTAKTPSIIYTGTLGSGVCTIPATAVIGVCIINVAASNVSLTSGCPDACVKVSE